MKSEVIRHDIVEKYLERFKSNSSKKSYRWAINTFFDTIKKNPETYFEENKEKKPEDAYNTYCDDMNLFINKLVNEEKAPLTIHLGVTAVKMFFRKHRIQFDGIELDEFALKYNGGAKTVDKILTPEELQIVLSNADLKLKTLYLFMLSSGMRRGELCKLKVGDVHMETHPTMIKVRGEYTKSGKSRTTFISDEASKLLKQWLEIRKDYLKKTCDRMDKQDLLHKKDVNDDRVFPFDASAVQDRFVRLLNNAGHPFNEQDKSTRRHLYNCHGLRKFFRSHLPEVISVDIVEHLMGHKNYLTDSYRHYTDEQLAEHYLKGMHKLQIYETGVSKAEVEGIVSDKDAIIRHLQEQTLNLQDTLKERDLKHDQKIKDFKREILEQLSKPDADNIIHKEKIKGFKKKQES